LPIHVRGGVEDFSAADDGRLAMKNTALIFWIALGLAAGGSYGGWVIYRHSQAQAASATSPHEADPAKAENDRMRMEIPADGPSVPTFKLINQDGKEFDSASLWGKVWVASVFFASCPAQCYKLNQVLSALQTDHDLADVRFISLTCDPTDDTPDVLKGYAARFDANFDRWTFLTGSDDAAVQKVGMSTLSLLVEHKGHRDDAVVLDRQSRIRGYFHLSDNGDVEKLRTRLKSLLTEKDAEATPKK
jgi:protein SCO1/2